MLYYAHRLGKFVAIAKRGQTTPGLWFAVGVSKPVRDREIWDSARGSRASAIRFQRVKEGAGLAFELVNLRKAVKLFEPVQIKIRLDFYLKLGVSI